MFSFLWICNTGKDWLTHFCGFALQANNADLLQCENCGHCVELYNEKDSDSEELKQTRENIKQWLSKILSNKALDQIHKTEVY